MKKKQAKNVMLYLMVGMTFCILYTGCKKTHSDINLHQISLKSIDNFNRIWFDDALRGHIVGGQQWENGTHVYTADEGETWRMDTLGDKTLLDICADSQGNMFATGVEGNIWSLGAADTLGTIWQKKREYLWIIMRGIAAQPDDRNFIVVGGEGYQNGIVIKLDAALNEVSRDSFTFELDDVAYTSGETAFAVGYGAVIRTDDGGETWEQLNVSGDFYKAIFFVTPQVGYIAGYAGTILKTTDGGNNWKHITDGTSRLSSGTPFRAIYFSNVDNGYIVGDEGTIWHTTDGGRTWDISSNIPKALNFASITQHNGKIWLVADHGNIAWFEE